LAWKHIDTMIEAGSAELAIRNCSSRSRLVSPAARLDSKPFLAIHRTG
jgi:hypothetical protein